VGGGGEQDRHLRYLRRMVTERLPGPAELGEKRPKGGQERRVVGGEEAPKREPPQETDNWGLETVPDARGQEGCGRWSIMS
jgi:hypothetical protein